MANVFNFDLKREKGIIDQSLFLEALDLKGLEREKYVRFLVKTFPNFIELMRKEVEDFRLIISVHHAENLKDRLAQDEELMDIFRRYYHFGYFEYFNAISLGILTAEQRQKSELTQKEEQQYYIKLMEVANEGVVVPLNKVLFTGPKYAEKYADAVIDAGIHRVGRFHLERGYIEYKIVEPKQGDTVYIGGNPVKLGEKLAEGGEAKLFFLEGETDKNLIAKVYCTTVTEDFPNCVNFQILMDKREKKLNALFHDVRYQFEHDQLIMPIEAIYDSAQNLIGVIMPHVKSAVPGGKIYELDQIALNSEYPYEGFNRLDLIEIGKQITQCVKMLHERDIIIGDINMRNFLVTGDSIRNLKVHLIDLDGCQIPGFPSYYETTGYRDPLWEQGSNKPRTKGNEVYGLMILLFELFAGVHPFQFETIQDANGTKFNNFQVNMQNRAFVYRYGNTKNTTQGMQPPRFARYVYSHMERNLQYLFKITFGEHEEKRDYRPSIEELAAAIDKYGAYTEQYGSSHNRLKFNNFGIPVIHRVEYKCSFENCTNHAPYEHINKFLTAVKEQGPVVKALFCSEHYEMQIEVNKLLKKASSKEEKDEFRKLWNAQIVKQEYVKLIDAFYEKNPNHKTAAEWQELRPKVLAMPVQTKKYNSARDHAGNHSKNAYGAHKAMNSTASNKSKQLINARNSLDFIKNR